MNIKKLLALVLALVCVFSFAACDGSQPTGTDGEESSSLKVESGEDGAVEQAKVTIANMTGKDAVSLLARKSGSEEWSDNILSQDYLHADMAVEITYNVSDNNIYDLRLVFEDESYQDFASIDFAAAKSVIYLDNAE